MSSFSDCHNSATVNGEEMATFRKRGSRWEAQIRKQGWPTQQQTFSSKPEAKAWACTVEAEMASGIFQDMRYLDGKTLADLLTRYALEVTPGKKSHATELCRINALLRSSFAETWLTDLTSQRICQWRDIRLAEVTGSILVTFAAMQSACVGIQSSTPSMWKAYRYTPPKTTLLAH